MSPAGVKYEGPPIRASRRGGSARAPRARRRRRTEVARRQLRRRSLLPRSYDGVVPELPEVEITARRLGAALDGAEVESALAPGVNALKTYDPPLSALEGARSRRCAAAAST